MNNTITTLAIMSAILATGMALSTLAPTNAFAATSSSSASNTNGPSSTSSVADSNVAASSGGAGPAIALCFGGATEFGPAAVCFAD